MPPINQVLARAKSTLANPHELHLLLADVLGCSPQSLIANLPDSISATQAKKFLAFAKKRATGYPLAYLLNSQPFYHHEFFVNQHVLIPRPETEMLVDVIIKNLRDPNSTYGLQVTDYGLQSLIADIGTGSGAIAISLAKAFPRHGISRGLAERGGASRSKFSAENYAYPEKYLARECVNILATDVSTNALAVAQKNAATHSVTDQITFLHGNLLEPIKKAGLTPDIIVANLPYLPAQEILAPTPNGTFVSADEWQTIKHEPRLALIGGNQGDELIRTCLQQAAILNPQPQALYLEAAPSQLPTLTKFAQKLFPNHTIKILKDLSNQDRFFIIKK